MRWRVVEQPQDEVISLGSARRHLRLAVGADGTNPDDASIAEAITDARQFLEARLQVALAPQKIEVAFDAFPTSFMELPMPPVMAVDSVTYVDAGGQAQPVSGYAVDLFSSPARLYPAFGATWPTPQQSPNAVIVTMSVGYDEDTLPGPIRRAMLLLIGHFYENREEVAAGVNFASLPMGVQDLVCSFRQGMGV